MTDPIAAMITMIKNASAAGKPLVVVPYSSVKAAVADCLVRTGFVASAEKKIRNERPFLEVTLLSTADGAARVHDVKRISKPSRRLYMGVKEIRPYKNGHGLFVFSTPKGILSDKEAKKEQVGGEIMFSIW
jgi:small subunit ribosomal protein S8